jgi:hypothetical protein
LKTVASSAAEGGRDFAQILFAAVLHVCAASAFAFSVALGCTPELRPVQPAEMGRIVAILQLGGLHHCYERRAA